MYCAHVGANNKYSCYYFDKVSIQTGISSSLNFKDSVNNLIIDFFNTINTRGCLIIASPTLLTNLTDLTAFAHLLTARTDPVDSLTDHCH